MTMRMRAMLGKGQTRQPATETTVTQGRRGCVDVNACRQRGEP